MTVEMTDRIEMTEEPDELTLDELFERVDRMPVPEGYKVEVVEGSVHMSPQRRTHWKVIRKVLRQLEDHFGEEAEILSDVRIDFPGYLNGFAPDLVKIAKGAQPDTRGCFAPQDVEFLLEVASKSTIAKDYGAKLQAYAAAQVPAYLIVDPYVGRCHLYTHPKPGLAEGARASYAAELTTDFGEPIDLAGISAGLTLSTDGFPRDE